MDSALIRPASPADLPVITRIYAQAVLHGTASFELEPPGEAEMTRRYANITEKGMPYLVAERSGAVVGYAYAGPFRERAAYRYTLEDSIYVAPDAQRGGIGRALLARLITESEARGFRQMIAVIGDSAQHGSIAVHRAAGFTDIGVMRASGFKFGRWLDVVLMQRALSDGDASLPGSVR